MKTIKVNSLKSLRDEIINKAIKCQQDARIFYFPVPLNYTNEQVKVK